MVIYSIYKALNTINGKIYIGFTENFEVRKTNHQNSKSKSAFHKALRKYGKDNFQWEIIYQSLDKQHCLKEMENYFIIQYSSSTPHGYNMCSGGGGGFCSEKQKIRMKYDNPMTKLRTNSGSFVKGHKHQMSKQTKEKIKQSKLGENNVNWNNPSASKHLHDKSFICKYCGICTTKGNIVRWHDDKCKHKK